MVIECMMCGEGIEFDKEYRYYDKVYCHKCSIDFKKDEIKKLGIKKQTECYPGYDPVPPEYDCDDYVSPNSKEAHNFDAKIMIMGQDWGDSENLQNMERNLKKKEETILRGYSRDEPYSRNLFDLLKRHFCINFDETFATNLFPFIRTGKIQPSYMRMAAEEYAKPQVELIQPKILLCFGDDTYKYLENVLRIGSRGTIDESIENPLCYNPFRYHNKIYIFWLTHLGAHWHYNRGIKKVNEYPRTGEGGWFLNYRKINKYGVEEPDYTKIGKIQNEDDWKKISDFFKNNFPMFDKCRDKSPV
jgi:restriction system protein